MRIHGLCLIKNEADVIEECLRAAARWCDHIRVWDNGSTDGTWEIVQRLAKELPQVTAWRRKETETFSDNMRGEIYEHFSATIKPGDWVARLDADEIFAQDPRTFLYAVPRLYDVVWYASLSYYFSSAAAQQYEQNPSSFDDSVPVARRCRYYFNHWSEARFARAEVMGGSWSGNANSGWPASIRNARVHPVRIICRHYCYRSPKQIQQRIETRAASAVGGLVFGHEAIKNWAEVVDPAAIRKHRWKQPIERCTSAELLERGWRSRVIPASSLVYDAHDGNFQLNEDLMPPIPVSQPSIAGEAKALAGRVVRAMRNRTLALARTP